MLPTLIEGRTTVKLLGEGVWFRTYLLDGKTLPKYPDVQGPRTVVKILKHSKKSASLLKTREKTISTLFRNMLLPNAALSDNIAKPINVGTTKQGDPYFEYEYVPGDTLMRWRKNTSPRPKDLLMIGKGSAHALADMHRENFLVLDPSPNNFILRDDGVVKLVDFNPVEPPDSPEKNRTCVGNIQIRAYEVWKGPADYRSDVCSWGLLQLWIAAGKAPFHTELHEKKDAEQQAFMQKLTQSKIDKLLVKNIVQLPKQLQKIVRKATRLLPEERYANGQELAIALQRSFSQHSRKHIIVALGVSVLITVVSLSIVFQIKDLQENVPYDWKFVWGEDENIFLPETANNFVSYVDEPLLAYFLQTYEETVFELCKKRKGPNKCHPVWYVNLPQLQRYYELTNIRLSTQFDPLDRNTLRVIIGKNIQSAFEHTRERSTAGDRINTTHPDGKRRVRVEEIILETVLGSSEAKDLIQVATTEVISENPFRIQRAHVVAFPNYLNASQNGERILDEETRTFLEYWVHNIDVKQNIIT